MTTGKDSKILLSVDRQSRHVVERLQKLQEIGSMLSAEQDLVKLLTLILRESRFLTNADAGTIFVREDEVTAIPDATPKDNIYKVTPFLALKVSQNDSVYFPFKEMRLPFDRKTISGHVAFSGEVVNLADAYHVPDGAPYTYSTAFDKASGYRCKSMLVLPMRNRAGETIGVLQLINKKRDPHAKLATKEMVERVVDIFDPLDEELMLALASQAAICIEKTKLYESIEKMFEGLVSSFTLALERRNRTTYGHCSRVMMYATSLAEAVNAAPPEMFNGFHFTPAQLKELRYAALLHDIGKIAVPEAVLDKQNKLVDSEVQAIVYRLHYAKAQGKPGDRMDDWAAFIRRANTPRPMTDDDVKKLDAIRAEKFKDVDGAEKPMLTDHEYENLRVLRGNLTPAERKQVEQHIVDTWEILKRIPWPRDLRSVANLAALHHEKLNGSGYAWKLAGAEIPLGGQILAIVDIYEALTAADRPYKPAMPVDKAVAILQGEVDRGCLNPKLFQLFLDKQIHATFVTQAGFVARAAEPMT